MAFYKSIATPSPWDSIPVGPAAGIPGVEPFMLRDIGMRMLDAMKLSEPHLKWRVVDPRFEPLVVALAAEIDRPLDQHFCFELRSALDHLVQPGGFELLSSRRVVAMGNRDDLYAWVVACPDRLHAVDRAMYEYGHDSCLADAIKRAQVAEIEQVATLIAEAFRRRLAVVPPAIRDRYDGGFGIGGRWVMVQPVTPSNATQYVDLSKDLKGELPVDLDPVFEVEGDAGVRSYGVFYDGEADSWQIDDIDPNGAGWYRPANRVPMMRWEPAPGEA